MKTIPAQPQAPWRRRLYTVVFEADTRAGRLFDVCLIYAITLSLVVVMLDSVASVSKLFQTPLFVFEWLFTLLFTVEYIARLVCAPRPMKYVLSFYGVVDLLALLPTYLALLFPELHALIDVRVLRLLRVFRVFKLTLYFAEYTFLASALAASRRKIMVFLGVVLMLVLVFATLMYVIEGPANGFTSIPVAMYWGITTMTTVGFGDITPKTDLGRFITSIMMLMGWGVLAVPTGIVTAEMAVKGALNKVPTTRTCPECMTEGLEKDHQHCHNCGAKLS
jgi:voltage-gated potassium channel